MTFHLITIFPHIFDSYFSESIIKRARKNKLIDIKIHNLRDWTTDKHKTVDDAPFGGGAGMVMKIEPLYRAVSGILYNVSREEKLKIKKHNILNTKYKILNTKTVLLSAKGKRWNQTKAKSYARLKNLILICGRYEGVDERITKFIDEEISIGDYVLTGGEIPALAIVDSITRLLPGALGNSDSAKFESHSTPGVLEYPQYTRPEIFTPTSDLKYPLLTKPACRPASPKLQRGERGRERAGVRLINQNALKKNKPIAKQYRVPKILLSGNHKKIEDWRKKHSKTIKPHKKEG